MRVLLYSATSRTSEGGVQAVYRTLARSLRRRGHDVIEGWAASAPAPTADEWAVPLHVPTSWRGLCHPRSVFAWGRSVARLFRGLYRLRPDVVHVHFVQFQALYFLLLRPFFGYRLVVSFHGSDAYYPDRVAVPALPFVARRADSVAAVSAPLQSQIRSLMGEGGRVDLVLNGVDADFWSATPRRPDPQTVVAVGRLERVKGFDLLVEAVRRLRETQDVRLTLVGDGRERRALERQVAEAGLREAVTFLGHCGGGKIREAFASGAVFALPSRSEGLPLAVLEAMASGLPVVAARVGGVPGVVAPEAGTLVDPDDPAALAEALRAYLTDAERAAAAGRAGQAIARAHSTEAMVDGYERLYERVAPDAPRSAHLAASWG